MSKLLKAKLNEEQSQEIIDPVEPVDSVDPVEPELIEPVKPAPKTLEAKSFARRLASESEKRAKQLLAEDAEYQEYLRSKQSENERLAAQEANLRSREQELEAQQLEIEREQHRMNIRLQVMNSKRVQPSAIEYVVLKLLNSEDVINDLEQLLEAEPFLKQVQSTSIEKKQSTSWDDVYLNSLRGGK